MNCTQFLDYRKLCILALVGCFNAENGGLRS